MTSPVEAPELFNAWSASTTAAVSARMAPDSATTYIEEAY